jgi:hypothetical protein
MFQSVTFGADNRTIVSTDHDHLNRGVQNPSALSDTAKANVNIATRTGELHTFNSHAGNAQVAPAVTTVQLQAPTGHVAILGTTVAPEVYEKMKETSPELFVEPEAKAAKQAEAAAMEADAAKEAAAVEEINRFVDPAAEAASLHVNSDVSLSDRTQLLWQLHSTGTVSGPTLQRVAEQMYLPVDQAVEALNAIHTNHSMQVATLCGAKGVNAQAFGAWAKNNRSTEMFRAIQVQANDRDFVRGWSGLVDEFKARGQK